MLRSQSAVIDRAVCLNAVLHVAHGWDRELAKTWLKREGLIDALTPEERAFVEAGKGNEPNFYWEIETAWVLVWALGLGDKLEFWSPVPDDLVSRLPDVDMEGCDRFRRSAHLRPAKEIHEELDLAYCLHWAVRQAQLDRRELPPSVVNPRVERRRHALEWLAGEIDWDEPNMDT